MFILAICLSETCVCVYEKAAYGFWSAQQCLLYSFTAHYFTAAVEGCYVFSTVIHCV